jgi:hypothetical protein
VSVVLINIEIAAAVVGFLKEHAQVHRDEIEFIGLGQANEMVEQGALLEVV